jgi:hypothetical protein
VGTVTKERRFNKLRRFLSKAWKPSSLTFVSGGQALNIRTTDPWWQLCIELLMHSSDIVVVDLSKVKTGTAWELKRLNDANLQTKCFFVAARESGVGLTDVVNSHFEEGNHPIVYFYNDRGELTDATEFAQALEANWMAALKRRGENPPFLHPS